MLKLPEAISKRIESKESTTCLQIRLHHVFWKVDLEVFGGASLIGLT